MLSEVKRRQWCMPTALSKAKNTIYPLITGEFSMGQTWDHQLLWHLRKEPVQLRIYNMGFHWPPQWQKHLLGLYCIAIRKRKPIFWGWNEHTNLWRRHPELTLPKMDNLDCSRAECLTLEVAILIMTCCKVYTSSWDSYLLPQSLQPHPFSNVGADFAGPITVKRGAKIQTNWAM